MSIRITFDRSIFHGGNFARLASSPFLKYCQSKRYSVYHSSVLIEETLNLSFNDDRINQLQAQIKFLITTGSNRWFQEIMDIWTGELRGKSKNDYLFISASARETLVRRLRDRIYLPLRNDKTVLQERNAITEKKHNMRKMFVDIRKSVGQELQKTQGAKPRGFNFRSFCDGNLDNFGTAIIRKYVRTDIQTEQLIDRWKQNKAGYPYFTLSMEAWLYTIYYAMTEHNAPIDRNAQMDIFLLVIARELDIVVSNDQKFMKYAFQALYGETKKEYLTLDEFLKRMG